jgi:small subunit ribosomal protein S20
MPIKKSAAKAAKQALKKRAVNVEFKDLMKSAVKAVKKAVEAKANNISDLVVEAQKRIDKASKRNIITKESASRKKSTLMRTMNEAGATLPVKEKTPKMPKKEKVVKEKTPANKSESPRGDKKTTPKPTTKKAPAKKTTTK